MIGKLKNFIYKIIRSSGYELIGRKNIVKHNSYDAIHKFILKEFVYKNIDDSKVIIFAIGAVIFYHAQITILNHQPLEMGL